MRTSALLLALLAATTAHADDSVFSQFDRWAARYKAANPREQTSLAAEGVRLAGLRRAQLLDLMRTRPAEALKHLRDGKELPLRVRDLMERQVDGWARYDVLCEYGGAMRARVALEGREFDVVPYGNWLGMLSRDRLHVVGAVLENQAVLIDGTLSGSDPQPSPATVGTKRLLYTRVDFSDDVGEPVTVPTVQNVMMQLDQFMSANSYGLTHINATIVPSVLRLPRTKASYGSANDTSGLLNDARAAARAAGFDPLTYDLDVVAFRKISAFGWAGLGRVGGQGTWINGSYGLGVIAHETGHNFGLSHANFWQAANETIIGSGNAQEYGSPFDTMGSGEGHFGVWYKAEVLGWLDANKWSTATTSNSFRILDLELPNLGGIQGVKVPISSARAYWLEYRPARGAAANHGAIINWGTVQPSTSLLLDMQPSTATADDSPLFVGKTFSDPAAAIHITPTGVVAGSPGGLDVVVNRGVFSTNRAPTVTLTAPPQANPNQSITFTATAMDADGDTLAYYWDFGEAFVSTNSATQTLSFAERDVLARVTVSDMKGGVGSANLVVRVGSPVTARINGQVTAMGQGVEGVRITAGSKTALTDSAGVYALVGIPMGPVTVSALKPGYALSALFTNPVNAGANTLGINFTASRTGVGIFGRVTSVGSPVANVTVSAGPYSAQTNATGDFELRNMPPGQYTLSVAGQGGATFAPVGWTNPVVVNTTPVTGRNFTEQAQAVSGVVNGVAGPHTVTDGVRTTQTVLSQGQWAFTFPRVPFGSYNFVATASGQLIVPMFTNPVVVGSPTVPSLVFNSTAGNGFLVSGRIEELGAGLSATTVQLSGAATAMSVTDSSGRYVFPNVLDGAYTVTPVRSGYTFGPAMRSVTVAGAEVPSQDFSVVGANARPVIVVPPSATPFPVTGTTADLFVLADDPAPGDEGGLTYAWTQTFGPAPAMISRNNSNAAKATTATFPRSGAWGFKVTATDPGMLSASDEVTVVVPQTPTTVAVTSNASSALSIADTRQFVASVNDQFGTRIEAPGDVTWSVMGACGTVTEFGKFTATAAGDCTVVASVGALMGTVMVRVQVSRVPLVLQQPKVTPNPVTGSHAVATATADDDMGEAALTYTWSAVMPPANVIFATNASNAAKTTDVTFTAVGSYVLQVDITDAQGNNTTAFTQMVQVTNGLAKVELSPAAGQVKALGTLSLSAKGKDFSNQDSDTGACTWAASTGSIDMNGVFTAPEGTGMATVTATCSGVAGTTQVSWSPNGPDKMKGCGCSSGEGVSALALLFGMTALRRRRARTVAALGLVAAMACGKTTEAPGELAQTQQALGEVVNGYPSDQERMLQVLINRARTGGQVDCDQDAGAPTSIAPFAYSLVANQSARFSSRHMAENSCFQNDNCCVLGDAGAGVGIGCIGLAGCAGSACNKTCDAGVGQGAQQRFALLGFASYFGSGIALGVPSGEQLYCQLLTDPSFAAQIFNDAGTEFSGGLVNDSQLACTNAYWTVAFGNGAVTVPRVPAGSAIYFPPNPTNTLETYFAANYFDPSGRAPRRASVVVDGHCFDLDLMWGAAGNGTYEAHFNDPDVIPAGCHAYYFSFVDADGAPQKFPSTGSLQVPIGTDVTCALSYDPAPQLAADCETNEPQCPTGARRSCYTGADMSLLGIGECRQGNQQCRNGFWGACRDMVRPFPEACDGLDNDCDGQIDEGNPGAGASCVIQSELGQCQAGVRSCVSGRLSCVGTGQPAPEVCDGMDNDCDGAIDDGFPTIACGVGMCFRMTPSCANGAPVTCDAGIPTAEVEDGKDNNCDGFVDDGFSCFFADGGARPNRTVWPLPGSVPAQPCAEQVQTCQADGGWSRPFGGKLPAPETCNGEDDDCDGVGENAVATQLQLGTLRCGVGHCTVRSASSCIGGRVKTCTPEAPLTETCNGQDDNCNGTIDEMCSCREGETRPCYTAPSETRDVGACKAGVRRCVMGNYTSCQAEVKPTKEICDGVDNDCDGKIDNMCVSADGGVEVDAGMGAVDGGTGPGTDPKKCGCSGSGMELFGALGLLALGLRRRGVRHG